MPERTQHSGVSEGCGDWSVRMNGATARISGAETYDYNFYSVEENKSSWEMVMGIKIKNKKYLANKKKKILMI
ncbi:MAG TPA: hypothetical protein VIY97_00440 [Candidatus Methanoperedens sp.]